MLTAAALPVKRIPFRRSAPAVRCPNATDSDSHRRGFPDRWTAMAMAFQARARPFAGRYSHRNRKRLFLLSDHDLRRHLHRPVGCHLVYPPLGRSSIRHRHRCVCSRSVRCCDQGARRPSGPDFQSTCFETDDRGHGQGDQARPAPGKESRRMPLDLTGQLAFAGTSRTGRKAEIKKCLTAESVF